MLKGNNKGFAITTVLYGLSILSILLIGILMSIMSNIRSNSRDIVKSVENDLNRVSKAESVLSSVEQSGTPTSQEYMIAEGQDGFYKIELWGAQGGTNGGYGAYTSGIIYLKEGDKIYFYIGKKGTGAATEVRARNGAYTEANSVRSRIMVAAGGGSNAGASGGTLYGYTAQMNPIGGQIDINGTTPTYGLTNNGVTNNTLAGYPPGYSKNGLSQASVTAARGSNGGGTGYYSSSTAASGGTSYISGYAGVETIDKNGNKYTGNHKSFYEDFTFTLKYVFLDGRMFAGVNPGDGRAKISRVSDTDNKNELKRNSVLKADTYRYIKDCATNSTQVRIAAISNGRIYENTLNTSGGCATLDMGARYSIDEVAVWHTNGDSKDFSNHKIQVSIDNSTWYYLKNASGISETESVTGIRISAYQSDTYNRNNQPVSLPTGDYYIMPVLTEGKVVTAAANSGDAKNPLTVQPFNGSSYQKWKIEKLISGRYKIVELARYKAMAIGILINGSSVTSTDENIEKNYIHAYNSYNIYQDYPPQMWNITPLADGTYLITSVAPVFDSSRPSGNIMPVPNSGLAFSNKMIIARNNNTTQRFKLIALDYGGN